MKKKSSASRHFNLWDLISPAVSEKFSDVKYKIRNKALVLETLVLAVRYLQQSCFQS